MAQQASKRPLRRVVVVFKTHFDLGFTDLPGRVMAAYTGPMFDAVRQVMQATSSAPEGQRYAWTLPAWPMKQFLHGESVPEETRASARQLVDEGRLFWHAWPFTTHTAFCGLEDLVRGLQISRTLSEEFGRWPLGAKQTDVPGHTWILPSLLVRAGVKFLHLGCNPGSYSPHVPDLFWWEGPDGARLLTYYSPGGYGTSLLPPEEWTLDTWLAVQQTVDNKGPHSPGQLEAMRRALEEQAPGVELVFGQLGDFAESLLEHPEQLDNLPVLPYDLADTWIHGVGTMPREVARVRALRHKLLALEEAAAIAGWPGESDPGDDFALARKIAPRIDQAYEQLMLFGEHTWGLDVKSTIKRHFGEEFAPARETEPYRRLEASWVAKAAYIDRAEKEYEAALQIVNDALGVPPDQDVRPSTVGALSAAPSRQSKPILNTLVNRYLRVEIDPASGGFTSLVDKRTGRDWVDRSGDEPFGGYRYDLYSARDIAEFMRAYGLYFQDWFVQDFGKAGYPEDSAHLTAYARNFALESNDGQTLLMAGGRLAPRQAGSVQAPEQQVSIRVRLPDGEAYIDLEYRVEGKVATPLAESAVVPFPLNLPKPTFRLGQVGSVIDPARDIAPGANRSLWCVDEWVDASDDRLGLGLIPLDMPLVSLGSLGIFEFEPERVPRDPVIYSHLFNTQWGTNFPQWLEGDFSFRIRLLPHRGDWRWGRLPSFSRRLLHSALPVEPAGGVQQLKWLDSRIWVHSLRLISVRPRHDGHGLVARYWDPYGLGGDSWITAPGGSPVRAVYRCDLMERPLEELPIRRFHEEIDAKFHFAPHAVETLLIEFEPVVGDE